MFDFLIKKNGFLFCGSELPRLFLSHFSITKNHTNLVSKEIPILQFSDPQKKLIMAASTAIGSSSSAALPPKKYDVFISFRGGDTRNNFTSHLHAELCRKKIQTYIDDRLDKGDEIGSSLIEAIEESHIAVVIFSETYAFSKWCLDELVKIMKCREQGQIVVPVFYKIDPSIVRKQSGNYRKAFAKHERDSRHNKEKIKKWRSALMEAANLSGWHSQNYRMENELVENIVKKILQKLNYMYSDDAERLVGIEHNYACIESMLKDGSRNVQIIGIWGMGGIGKTTLAAVAFAKHSSLYEASCFMAYVREEESKHGLNYLRNKLLAELLEDDDLHISTPLVETSFHMRRLSRKKVLIVLDDVNTTEQLEYLIGGADCLGPASRVIITTRDKQVLSKGVDEVHEVKKLDFQESLQLFCLNAFNKSDPEIEYEELSKRVVDYAGGVPLAIKILGSYLCSRNIEIWRSAIDKLEKFPNPDIQNVLRLSYNGLDDEEKEIFLDIAFFFRDERKENLVRIMNACGFHAAVGIECLLSKALITITPQDHIQMHDLIQEMGKEIVRQESIKNPGNRSRLRDPEEIYELFKNNKVTDTVEGIFLNMSQIKSDIYLSHDIFTKMSRLRLLKFYYGRCNERSNSAHLSTSLDFLPESIRYLFWDEYPSTSLPSTFCPINLVEISMRHSKVEKLWDGIQDLVHLNKIDFSCSKHLKELPDFSKAYNLESITLDFCTSLCQVHSSILSLQKLVFLRLHKCKHLKSDEIVIHSRCLRILDVKGCSSLKGISIMSKEMRELDLSNSGIVELYSPIGAFDKLDRLLLPGCLTLKNFPNALTCPCHLSYLNLSGVEVTDSSKRAISLNWLRSLRYLSLDNRCNLYQLPENIKLLSHLSWLSLANCQRLQFVELPPSVEDLDATNCTSLETLLFTDSSPALSSASNKGKLSIDLGNCVKLNENSVNTMLKRMKEGAIKSFVYPGRKVPNWFMHRTTEAAITIEPHCPSTSNLLCGAVCCLVVSPVTSSGWDFCIHVGCKYNMTDRKVIRSKIFPQTLPSREFGILDHVYIWYDDLPSLDPSSFEFFVEPTEKMEKVAISIKGCGVQLIYDTKNEHVTASSANILELKASVIPPIHKSIFPTSSTATNWKNQRMGLIDILSP